VERQCVWASDARHALCFRAQPRSFGRPHRQFGSRFATVEESTLTAGGNCGIWLRENCLRAAHACVRPRQVFGVDRLAPGLHGLVDDIAHQTMESAKVRFDLRTLCPCGGWDGHHDRNQPRGRQSPVSINGSNAPERERTAAQRVSAIVARAP
jgi:hypothetical protein